ncbi:hypothetical protein ADUPG1_006418 [Aduncisulcus paluster]|uniref:Uncharacterized protein n=1 Tax=Aduncisulcus paluster TaxID=2918883 RepID=A0ABQ5KI82_9EUKA|nr:hypothetical protein ADUPG1_006418 [Aduncisulcus paluster]
MFPVSCKTLRKLAKIHRKHLFIIQPDTPEKGNISLAIGFSNESQISSFCSHVDKILVSNGKSGSFSASSVLGQADISPSCSDSFDFDWHCISTGNSNTFSNPDIEKHTEERDLDSEDLCDPLPPTHHGEFSFSTVSSKVPPPKVFSTSIDDEYRPIPHQFMPFRRSSVLHSPSLSPSPLSTSSSLHFPSVPPVFGMRDDQQQRMVEFHHHSSTVHSPPASDLADDRFYFSSDSFPPACRARPSVQRNVFESSTIGNPLHPSICPPSSSLCISSMCPHAQFHEYGRRQGYVDAEYRCEAGLGRHISSSHDFYHSTHASSGPTALNHCPHQFLFQK